MMNRIASGHRIARSTDDVVGGLVRGRKAVSRESQIDLPPVESESATSAPYLPTEPSSGGAVRIGRRQVPAVEVADHRRHRAGRIDAHTVADALPHGSLAGD